MKHFKFRSVIYFVFSLFFVLAARANQITTNQSPIENELHNIHHQELKADLVIFSFDRPLQLYALLESIEKYITGLGQIHIIYRASNDQFSAAYEEVHKRFNTPQFIKQGDNPRNDFKPLTLQATFSSPHDYVIFAVDDIIVKDFINITQCIELLEKFHAYGFYLRLGKNLTECYSVNHPQKLPPLVEAEKGIFAWRFIQGEYDWNYPNTVDMTVYRKKDIKVNFEMLSYQAPNSLEGAWAGRGYTVNSLIGLCYETSKIVNLPLNRVQNEYSNRSMNFLMPDQLLNIFNEGLKISIEPLFKINNEAAHMAYEPIFEQRTQ
jgi:hypothetical protein